MKKAKRCIITGLFCLISMTTISDTLGNKSRTAVISWNRCLSQRPEFYATDEAVRIADNVLLYQRDSGGWRQNIDMARVLSEQDKAELHNAKSRKDSTLDNGATHTQIRYLSKVYYATGLERFRQALLRGVDYLLKAQYDNGGWPQSYPWEGRSGYSRYITFNDNAMIGAMNVLRDMLEKKAEYAFADEARRQKAQKAVQRGIDCILKCQIIVDGKHTAWCQQHDEKTFEPRPARSFEPAAITAGESVGVVKFLMGIDNPSPEVIQAVQCAVAWFDRVKLTGIRQINKPDESLERGYDNVINEDTTAPPLWARLYEIGSNRPLFGDRDGKKHYQLVDISSERRTGYAWYGYWPAELLARDYPAWQKKWTPEKDVLSE